ncbi:selenoprotein S-like [Rhopilema esculentum]|uniref:selenoprotein S-like n=1 Tax=Rhopilema esculentum TaxID=499914 RepID=UPI0031DE5B6C|eukprot:gene8520-14519_t
MDDNDAFGDAEKPAHANNLQNSTPDTLVRMGLLATNILEKYGWFIILGIVLLFFVLKKLKPFFQKWKSQMEDYSNKKSDDPNHIYQQHESMEKARKRLQEKIDLDVEKAKERKQQLEAEKRREKIEDWERHQLGKGYRSKIKKPHEETPAPDSSKPKPKPKKPLRPDDYNPLMGQGGSYGYRPTSRRDQSGGG